MNLYKKNTYIIGTNHEAINSAILLASLDMPVTLIASQKNINNTLRHYQFDRQMDVLWHLYVSQQKINLWYDKNSFFTEDYLNQDAIFWVFTDELSPDDLEKLCQYCQNPHSQIIFSGMDDIGNIDKIAKNIHSSWVYYLPFIFMKDGANFNSLFSPDLVLIGEKTKNSHLYCQILMFFINHAYKTHLTDIKTAEFARSSIIGMLGARLSFINELARLADSEQISIKEIENILRKDKRIGKAYLSAGWGFGGRSLPKELVNLKEKFKENKVETALIESIININEDQKELIFRKFWQYFHGFIDDKTVVIWGAGYRNEAGITANSAIHLLLKLLWSYNINTYVYSNNTTSELEDMYGDNDLFTIIDHPYQKLKEVDALFIINWSLVLKPDIHQLNQIRLPIFDAKNILSQEDIRDYQGDYFGIGQQKIKFNHM